MKNSIKLFFALTAIASASAANAQAYGEVGYTNQRIVISATDGVDSGKIKSSSGALRGVVGYKFHPNLAIEGMLALGVSDGNIKTGDAALDAEARAVGAKLGLKNAFGVFVKPQFDITPELTAYGRLGFNRVNLKAKADGESESEGRNAFAYGVGASYNINKSLSVSADWMMHIDKTVEDFGGGAKAKAKSSGVAVSLQYRF